MIPLPKVWFAKVLAFPHIYELAVVFFALFGGVANAIRGFNPDAGTVIGWLWAVAAGGVFISSAIKVAVVWNTQWAKDSTHELVGCLEVLHAILLGLTENAGRLRLTIHAPNKKGRHLVQITDYVGAKYPGRNIGRKFAVASGIIGKAYGTKEPQVGDRSNLDPDLFVQELQSEWRFSLEDALEIDQSARCWLAWPVSKGEKVYGIVFADSTIPGFFDEKVQEIFGYGVAGIAEYVIRRYPN